MYLPEGDIRIISNTLIKFPSNKIITRRVKKYFSDQLSQRIIAYYTNEIKIYDNDLNVKCCHNTIEFLPGKDEMHCLLPYLYLYNSFNISVYKIINDVITHVINIEIPFSRRIIFYYDKINVILTSSVIEYSIDGSIINYPISLVKDSIPGILYYSKNKFYDFKNNLLPIPEGKYSLTLGKKIAVIHSSQDKKALIVNLTSLEIFDILSFDFIPYHILITEILSTEIIIFMKSYDDVVIYISLTKEIIKKTGINVTNWNTNYIVYLLSQNLPTMKMILAQHPPISHEGIIFSNILFNHFPKIEM